MEVALSTCETDSVDSLAHHSDGPVARPTLHLDQLFDQPQNSVRGGRAAVLRPLRDVELGHREAWEATLSHL